MNYTEIVKEEIYKNIEKEGNDKLAFLTGITKSVASLQLYKDKKYSLEYEFKDEVLAMKTYEIIKQIFNVELEMGFISFEPRIYTITINGNKANDMLKQMGLSHYENNEFVFENNISYVKDITNLSKAQNYMQGVFVSLGSVYFPEGIAVERGYHIEFSFTEEDYAQSIKDMLGKCGINLSYIDRETTYALYGKSSEIVSDTLAFLKAMDSVIKLNEINVQREVNNNVNRESNIMAANIDKTIMANTKYISAIETLDKKIGIDNLEEKMARICRARLEDKQSSMSALSDKLGITKSALNRMLKKILEKVEEING